ncbi:BatA domain-containing protein [candidate division WOR-3 bacterium]|nr:BatA domain-containing protein [candidate division WOR-3 bacterium]
MFLNPVLLLLSSAAVFPIIIHLARKYGKKEMVFPASCLIEDCPLPLRKKFKLKRLIQLMLRILIIFSAATAFSMPVLGWRFPFSRTVSNSAVVLDVSESVTRSGIYAFEESKIFDYVSIVCVTGKGETKILNPDSFSEELNSERMGSRTADIPLAYLLCKDKGAKEFFLVSDSQKASWKGMEFLLMKFKAVCFPKTSYLFTIKSIVFPPWSVAGDTAIIFISKETGSDLWISSGDKTEHFLGDAEVFIPVFLEDRSETLTVFSSAETLEITVNSMGTIPVFSNSEEILDRLTCLFPSPIFQRTQSPESADLILLDEGEPLNFYIPFSNDRNMILFLEDGSKLGNYARSNFSVNPVSEISGHSVIREGVLSFLGVIASSHVSIENYDNSSVLSRFENGDPALIKNDNAYVFSFNPSNSTIFQTEQFPLALLNLAFEGKSSFSENPYVPVEERSSGLFDEESLHIQTVSIENLSEKAMESASFDISPFLTYFLFFLVAVEGTYSYFLKRWS